MKISKKLLSIILSVNFLFISIIPLSVLAYGGSCYAKNSKGGYVDPECADKELLKVCFYKTTDFIDIENLGAEGEDESYAFNFRALDEVFEKKKLTSTKKLYEQFDLLRKEEADLKNNNNNIWNKINIFHLFSSCLTGAISAAILGLGKFFAPKCKNKQINHAEQITPTSSRSQTPMPNDFNLQQISASHSKDKAIWGSTLGGLIGGLIYMIVYPIKARMKFVNDSKNIGRKMIELNEKIKEITRSNKRKEILLNLLLYHLEHPEEIDFDCVMYAVWYRGYNDMEFHWDPKSSNINYTKEELESFPQKFKEVAAKIRKNLEENIALDAFNSIQTTTSSEYKQIGS